MTKLTLLFSFVPFFLSAQISNQDENVENIEDTVAHEPGDESPGYPLSPSAIEHEVEYTAEDSIRFEMEEETAYLYGNAHITYGDMELEAPYVYINWEKNQIHAESYLPYDTVADELVRNVSLMERGRDYQAERAVYNFETDEGIIYHLYTEEGEGFIHGDVVKKDADDNFYINEAKYTTCDIKDEPHFHIAAHRLKVTSDNQIITGPANLVIAGIPLPLALPFGFFPDQTDRSSGIIPPSYGESGARGFFLRNGGYYFALSDYFDLALRGDIYSKGSWRSNVSSNYQLRKRFEGNVNLNYAIGVENPETPNEIREEDFFVEWRHRQDPRARPHSNFSANVRFGSSEYLSRRSDDFDDRLRSEVQSSVNFSQDFPNTPFSMSAGMNHNMNNATGDVSFTAPNANLSMSRINPFRRDAPGPRQWYEDIGVNYSMDFRNQVRNIQEEAFYSEEIFDHFQNGIRHNLPVSTNFNVLNHFTVNPSLTYSGLMYFERELREPDQQSGEIFREEESGFFHTHDFNFNTNINTRLFGLFHINSLGITSLRHVFTPTLGLSYRPDLTRPELDYYREYQDTTGRIVTYSPYSDQIFGAPGGGRQGRRQTSISLNLDNNLEMKVRDGEQERKIQLIETISASANYDLLADSMHLSNISLRLRTTFLNHISAQVSGTLDPYIIDEAGNRLDQYQFNEDYSPGRLTSGRVSLSTRLEPGMFGADGPRPAQSARHHFSHYGHNYVDFQIPWSMGVNYSMNYSRPVDEATIRQNMRLDGDIRLTPKWRIGYNAHLNVDEWEINNASLNVYREIHCWHMQFEWIPLGQRQRFMITIRPNASILEDMKLERRRDYYDF